MLIEHINLANFVNPDPKNAETYGYVSRGSVSLSMAAMTFDVSVLEEFLPLTNGMTAVIASDEEILNPLMLGELIVRNKVDIMTTTPTYLSNIVECWSILIIPMAMVFALGFYTKRMKLAYSIYGVMLCAYLAGVGINVYQEMNGNPRIDDMGIAQDNGSMEGKEVRLGAGATALWSITTTVTSNGSVNGMHDSTMPLSGMMEMLNMQINTWFGGVGVGWMNYYTFIIIAVFISGLMVGRTPEFLGKKVEAREMKIATIVALLHPFVILVFTAISCYLLAHHPEFVESEGGWLNNPGFHGLSEQFYEFTSCAANNGSGFEGLGDNTYFWNYACGWVLILSRFLPIVGQVAIAGLLAQKRFIPESAGTLKTDTFTLAVMTFAVIFIVAALSFFPAHALSTIAEHFSL